MNKIDLHIHTNVSDGEFSPKQIVDKAIDSGLKAIAITDHDSVLGIKEAVEYAEDKDLEVIPGIEISCYESEIGYDEVHILGLFIDYNNPKLIEFTEKIKEDRERQKKKIIINLNKLGFKIRFKDIKGFKNYSIGRPHIASYLLEKYPHEFSSVGDVFDKYIGTGKPAYSDRGYKVRMVEAIKIIKDAGGLPFLAHPGCFKKEDAVILIEQFIDLGGMGIETIYPYEISYAKFYDQSKSDNIIQFFREYTKKNNLLETGGSDFHGKIRDTILGFLNIDYKILEEIKKNKK